MRGHFPRCIYVYSKTSKQQSRLFCSLQDQTSPHDFLVSTQPVLIFTASSMKWKCCSSLWVSSESTLISFSTHTVEIVVTHYSFWSKALWETCLCPKTHRRLSATAAVCLTVAMWFIHFWKCFVNIVQTKRMRIVFIISFFQISINPFFIW